MRLINEWLDCTHRFPGDHVASLLAFEGKKGCCVFSVSCLFVVFSSFICVHRWRLLFKAIWYPKGDRYWQCSGWDFLDDFFWQLWEAGKRRNIPLVLCIPVQRWFLQIPQAIRGNIPKHSNLKRKLYMKLSKTLRFPLVSIGFLTRTSSCIFHDT